MNAQIQDIKPVVTEIAEYSQTAAKREADAKVQAAAFVMFNALKTIASVSTEPAVIEVAVKAIKEAEL